ncbi:hypothetical protein EON63_04980 [archaeon]|nr:MAG: hypothetical protein EON63_04980 [archaeon]
MFNRTRRKSGDAPATNNKTSEGQDSISLQRSDGVHHDLNSVFASAAIQDYINQSTREEESARASPPKDDKHEDHDRISISRSDGVTHDLNRVYKASTDTTGESMTPSTTGQPFEEKRKPSFTLKEFAKSLSLTSATPTSTSIKNNVSEANSAFLPKSVRIVHMSDTHNFLNKNFRSAFLPYGDILVHTGNFTNRGMYVCMHYVYFTLQNKLTLHH